jgi:hypothetical protein
MSSAGWRERGSRQRATLLQAPAVVDIDHLGRHGRRADIMVEAIRQLQRRGVADPWLDPVIAAAWLGAMVSRFGEEWFLYGGGRDFDEGVDQFVMLFLNDLHLSSRPSDGGLRRAADVQGTAWTGTFE